MEPRGGKLRHLIGCAGNAHEDMVENRLSEIGAEPLAESRGVPREAIRSVAHAARQLQYDRPAVDANEVFRHRRKLDRRGLDQHDHVTRRRRRELFGLGPGDAQPQPGGEQERGHEDDQASENAGHQ